MSVSVDGGQSAYNKYQAELERRKQEEIERRKREEEERKKAEAKRKAEEEKKAQRAEAAEEARQAEEDRRAEEDRQATQGSVFEEDNEEYFDRQRGTTAKGATTSQTVDNLNDTLEQRNRTDDTEIHGMSDQEYAEYRRIMYEEYGIALEDGYNYGHFQNVAVAMG